MFEKYIAVLCFVYFYFPFWEFLWVFLWSKIRFWGWGRIWKNVLTECV